MISKTFWQFISRMYDVEVFSVTSSSRFAVPCEPTSQSRYFTPFSVLMLMTYNLLSLTTARAFVPACCL